MSRIRKLRLEQDVTARATPVREVGVNPHLLRAVNVVGAVGLTVVSLPVLLVAMLAVRLTSHGPVIYRQVRVGMDRRTCGDHPECRRSDDIGGRPFTIYKLRSMVVNAEQGTGAVWKLSYDLTYLKQRRLRTDMHILARTVPVILKRFGAN